MTAAAPKYATAAITPAAFMRVLADETRLRAMLLLQHKDELCVCELTEALAVSQPKMSRHLAYLREAGVVENRRSGQWIHYHISAALPAWAAALLQQLAEGVADEMPFSNDIRRVIRAIARNRSECEQ